MKITLGYLVVFMLVGISLNAQSTTNDSTTIILSMPGKEILDTQQLVVDVTITSHKKHILEVPVQAVWGYALYHTGFLNIQIQRQVNGKFVDVPITTRIDSYMGVDVDTLRTNESKVWSFPLSRIHTFTQGKYRIRFLVSLSALNPVSDAYSDWCYFAYGRYTK